MTSFIISLSPDILQPAVYIIKCKKNGKMYVGSSQSPKNRFFQHCCALNNNTHPSALLQSDWYKYGKDSFELGVFAKEKSFSKRLQIEKNLILKIKSEGLLYNAFSNFSPGKIKWIPQKIKKIHPLLDD